MQFRQWKRREVITLLGGAAAGWPVAARAQQTPMPVIGFLTALGRNDRLNLREAFRRGLSEAGYVEGRNAAIEYRFAGNDRDRLPGLAADLVARKVTVIAATGGGNSIAAATTTTIPIVFTYAGDPIVAGYVASLNRPGGNVTGVSWFSTLLAGKGVGLLHELVPKAAVVAMLANRRSPESARAVSDAQEAARTLGLQLRVLTPAARTRSAPPSAPYGNGAPILVSGDPYFTARRRQIVALARVTPSRPSTSTASTSRRAG
jgi:putative ABC transport system substrate-binding protein